MDGVRIAILHIVIIIVNPVASEIRTLTNTSFTSNEKKSHLHVQSHKNVDKMVMSDFRLHRPNYHLRDRDLKRKIVDNIKMNNSLEHVNLIRLLLDAVCTIR